MTSIKEHGYGLIDWARLELTYLRIKKEGSDGEFLFIPVWRLATDEHVVYSRNVMEYETIFINAIDGSVIDLEEQGVINSYYSGDKTYDTYEE